MTKYLVISLLVIAVVVFIYFEGKKAGKDEAHLVCDTQQIKAEENVANTVVKAKKIAIDNSMLDRDKLIDKL